MNSKFPEIPDDLRALMAEVGPRWGTNPAAHVKLMVDQFSKILKQAPKDSVTVRRNISYGSHPRKIFDLFTPDHAETRRAAVVFVHGGAFFDGHPNRTERPTPTFSSILLATGSSGSMRDTGSRATTNIRRRRMISQAS